MRPTSTVASTSVILPSTQSRQIRLQQLTTQLLWRLQQSSPFHSCSTANLVLPNLPEATPTLGIPTKPARLLPGLEESQGALYEIGVSDDGTFVGLTEDELDESLTNLKAMAASLGCVVDVLRKVIVGQCERDDPEHTVNGSGPLIAKTENLWVAEALVRPELDKSRQPSPTGSPKLTSMMPHETLNGIELPLPEISRSKVEQLRVSITGATTSGKSSLLGTLTTSILDNGRGKSRLNLLKHRHEIASGVTSSVAQELIGYRTPPSDEIPARSDPLLQEVINYASENVSSWNDIHAWATRLIFLSDSPGLPRYSKSAIRTLVSWKPNWTVLCMAANHGEEDVIVRSSQPTLPVSAVATTSDGFFSTGVVDPSLAHLELCLKLGLPLVIAVTKMDVATKLNLRQTLSKVLSVLKAADRKPVLMSTSDSQGRSLSDQGATLQCVSLADEAEVGRVMNIVAEHGLSVVPIVLTSAMTGQGIGKLHGLLRSIPIQEGTGARVTSATSSMHLQQANGLPSKIFQVDEVFAMPPSKVYSATRHVDEGDHGTVLCGHILSDAICIGDVLKLGPFLSAPNDENRSQNSTLQHSVSFPNPDVQHRALSHGYSQSIPAAQTPPIRKAETTAPTAIWQPVRVVSIRNLRLPSRSLLAGQVGTIGVEPINRVLSSSCDLRRARKGMILAFFTGGDPSAYRSFTGSFPASGFKAQDSPPLILGGHATVYVNSIRAAVRVTSVSLTEHDGVSEPSDVDDKGVFAFDGDEQSAQEGQYIRIKFKFLNTAEWMRLDDRVLVVPNAAAAGPITGGSVAATGGLNGFVGRICDMSV
jgi:GTPase